MCLGVYDFVRRVKTQVAVSGYQTFEAQEYDTLGGMEKVLGAHDGIENKRRSDFADLLGGQQRGLERKGREGT